MFGPTGRFFYKNWNGWSAYWLFWLGVGFLVPESIALFTGHPENTLSEQVWHLSEQGARGGWTFGHFMVAAFVVWLAFHLILGWFR
jgi:hypothetical protein